MCKPLPESIGDYRLDEPDPHAFDEEPYGEDEDEPLLDLLWIISTGKTRRQWRIPKGSRIESPLETILENVKDEPEYKK